MTPASPLTRRSEFLRVDVGDQQAREREALLLAQVFEGAPELLRVFPEVAEAELLHLRDGEAHRVLAVGFEIGADDLFGRVGEDDGSRR